MLRVLFFLTFFFISILSANLPAIHVFGDSHSLFSFRASRSSKMVFELINRESFTRGDKPLELTFKIHWLGPRTMHRVGRDGMDFLNLKAFDFEEGDVAVFIFGEIDVRNHIEKQRDYKGRDFDEIIYSLARNYIETIAQNKSCYEEATCVVMSIVPPNNNDYLGKGPLSDRVMITQRLNQTLRELSEEKGILFLDIYWEYALRDGSFNPQYNDGSVHIHSSHNRIVKEKLLDLLMDFSVLPDFSAI